MGCEIYCTAKRPPADSQFQCFEQQSSNKKQKMFFKLLQASLLGCSFILQLGKLTGNKQNDGSVKFNEMPINYGDKQTNTIRFWWGL